MLRKLAQAPIHFYRYCISPLLGPRCRFVPTCSEYALEAIEKHGISKGLILTLKRLVKCHPWCRCERHDPVPDSIAWGTLIGYKRQSRQ